MTPIINPWVFYWIHVFDVLNTLGIVFLILGGIAFACYLIFSAMDEIPPNKSLIIIWSILLSIFFTLAVFVPAKDLMCKMVVAQNVTYERVEVATDVVKDVYEDIMELFEENK